MTCFTSSAKSQLSGLLSFLSFFCHMGARTASMHWGEPTLVILGAEPLTEPRAESQERPVCMQDGFLKVCIHEVECDISSYLKLLHVPAGMVLLQLNLGLSTCTPCFSTLQWPS